MPRKRLPPVYSTNPNVPVACPRCGKNPCHCQSRKKSLPPEQQVAHIRREKKGRRGKTVIVVQNLQLKPEDMKSLGKRLKQACGTGGTVKDGNIEIQGDHREKVAAELETLGYKTKFTGG
jgi:translation initiation factor 1